MPLKQAILAMMLGTIIAQVLAFYTSLLIAPRLLALTQPVPAAVSEPKSSRLKPTSGERMFVSASLMHEQHPHYLIFTFEGNQWKYKPLDQSPSH